MPLFQNVVQSLSTLDLISPVIIQLTPVKFKQNTP